MRTLCLSLAACLIASGVAIADEKTDAKQAPTIVLQSADGKKSYDLAKLTAEGPVLVRLTCACSGCDLELPYFQALQTAYQDKGLKTIAAFREKPEAAESYATKKGVQFLWVSDPNGDLWKKFDSKEMPTNILIDKGGAVIKVVPGCTKDGKNAQTLSAEIAKLLKAEPKTIVPAEQK